MRKILIILSLIIIMPLVSAQNYSQICNQVYYFIINHLDSNNTITYNNTDLSSLAINLSIPETLLQPYINQFIRCKDYTNLVIPQKNVGNLFIVYNNTQCSVYTDSAFFDYNYSPSWFPLIYINYSCFTIDIIKYIVNLDPSGTKIIGIKLWFIFIGIVIFISYELFTTKSLLRKKSTI